MEEAGGAYRTDHDFGASSDRVFGAVLGKPALVGELTTMLDQAADHQD